MIGPKVLRIVPTVCCVSKLPLLFDADDVYIRERFRDDDGLSVNLKKCLIVDDRSTRGPSKLRNVPVFVGDSLSAVLMTNFARKFSG